MSKENKSNSLQSKLSKYLNNTGHCTVYDHYSRNYLKSDPFKKCVAGDTLIVAGDTKVKLDCRKRF